jgi:hypothetical protein
MRKVAMALASSVKSPTNAYTYPRIRTTMKTVHPFADRSTGRHPGVGRVSPASPTVANVEPKAVGPAPGRRSLAGSGVTGRPAAAVHGVRGPITESGDDPTISPEIAAAAVGRLREAAAVALIRLRDMELQG